MKTKRNLRGWRCIAVLCALMICMTSLAGCLVTDTNPHPQDAKQTKPYETATRPAYVTSDTKPSGGAETGTETDAETETDTAAPAECSHSYGAWSVTKQPGCEAEGLQVRTCGLCGSREELAVAATGHTEEAIPASSATCVLAGSEGGKKCTVCGVVLESPTVVLPKGHPSFSNGICTVCGIPKDSAEGLSYLDRYNQSYGYEYLGTMNKSAARQQLYRSLETSVRAFHTDPSLSANEDLVAVSVNFGALGLTETEALEVWKTYRDDNPLYYWISNSISYSSTTLNLMTLPEYAAGDVRMATNQALYQSISAYLSKIPEGATDYEIALLMHDALVDAIDYAYDENGIPQSAPWAHSILGVFDERGAVCEGFAKAYQLLLNFHGVDCLLVTGWGNGEAHAWNMIRLGEKWYGVDVTWDDNNEETFPYLFFCLSESKFYSSHQKDLPTASGLEFLYAVPTLTEYSLEWVDVYKNATKIGRFENLSEALAAMVDPNGYYTLKLCDGKDGTLIHKTARYHLYGDLPAVKDLTIQGTHTLKEGGTFSSTQLFLMNDVSMQGRLTLKSVFVDAEKPVNLYRNGYSLQYGATKIYYSLINVQYDNITEKETADAAA